MKILEYHGLDQVRKMTYHSLQAEGVLRIYEMVYASLNELFDEKEATKLRQAFVKNKVQVHELSNAPYRDRDITVPGFYELVEERCIDPRRVAYETEILIYNDVVAFYTYDKKAHGVEIQDGGFAKTQAQIFDQLWQKASRPITGYNGRTSLF